MNRPCALALLMLAVRCSAAAAPKNATVDVYTTAKGTQLRLTKAPAPLTFEDLPQPLETQHAVFLDPGRAFQTLIGIGGALTDAAADTWAALPKDKQQEVVRALYDPKTGNGYTLARTNIHSCDYSSATYTYIAEGDKDLSTFSIAHDLQNRIPLIKQAIAAAGGKLTLFASPWSPPAFMKDNGDMLHGGRLKPEYRKEWAQYFVKFILAYEKAGVPIWGVTIQNEPMAKQTWESSIWTAQDERDFLRDDLGPAFERAGLGSRKIIVWDHNRDLLYHRVKTILDDPAAAKYAWGIGYHWYENWAGGEMQYDNVRRVAEAYPGKPLLLTEATTCPYDAAKLDDWTLGETYGRSMVHDFNNGAVGWTDWNVLLDQNGGPNHVGNYCFAAIHGDTKTGALRYTNVYHYMGHFSRFIRPGARRIAAVSSSDSLLTTGFANPDGTLAVVVMNRGDAPLDYLVWLDGKAARATSPARSIATLVVKDSWPLPRP